jgi:YggT family protein
MLVGNALIGAFLEITYMLLSFLVWMLIISAVLSWLIAFGVVNPYNRFVNMISDMVGRITEPLLVPVRRLIPPMGGVDLAPMALIFILWFLQSFIRHLAY